MGEYVDSGIQAFTAMWHAIVWSIICGIVVAVIWNIWFGMFISIIFFIVLSVYFTFKLGK